MRKQNEFKLSAEGAKFSNRHIIFDDDFFHSWLEMKHVDNGTTLRSSIKREFPVVNTNVFEAQIQDIPISIYNSLVQIELNKLNKGNVKFSLK